MHIIAHEHSYDIIGQKSLIGQKFLPPRAPLQYQKYEIFCKYLVVFLLNFDHSELPISATYCEAWKLSKKTSKYF